MFGATAHNLVDGREEFSWSKVGDVYMVSIVALIFRANTPFLWQEGCCCFPLYCLVPCNCYG